MVQFEAAWSVILDFYPDICAKDYSNALAAAREIKFTIDGQKVELEATSQTDAESIQNYFSGLYRQAMIVRHA